MNGNRTKEMENKMKMNGNRTKEMENKKDSDRERGIVIERERVRVDMR